MACHNHSLTAGRAVQVSEELCTLENADDLTGVSSTLVRTNDSVGSMVHVWCNSMNFLFSVPHQSNVVLFAHEKVRTSMQTKPCERSAQGCRLFRYSFDNVIAMSSEVQLQ